MSQLVLITGPRARDVAQVLPEGWEVRDYLAAPLQVLLAGRQIGEARDIEAAIRSLPGGEEWLVGLVIPEPLKPSDVILFTRQDQLMPDRLAILAPDPGPPPSLEERVRAWGGETWDCYLAKTGKHVILTERHHGPDPGSGVLASGDTWDEAVCSVLET